MHRAIYEQTFNSADKRGRDDGVGLKTAALALP